MDVYIYIYYKVGSPIVSYLNDTTVRGTSVSGVMYISISLSVCSIF